jgi:hypothetical protein
MTRKPPQPLSHEMKMIKKLPSPAQNSKTTNLILALFPIGMFLAIALIYALLLIVDNKKIFVDWIKMILT